jgi:hypothetical protein
MGKINSKNRPLLFLTVVLVGMTMWGCGPKTVTTLIHKDSLFELHLQRTIGKDRKPVDAGYQHPLSLSPEEMNRLLKSIQIRYRPGIFQRLFSEPHPETEQAFSDEEIQRMSIGISKALATATSADRINFQLKHPRGIFTPGLTTGAIYVKEDRLIIILGNYQYASPAGTDNRYERLADPLDPQDGQTVTIIPGVFQEPFRTERRSLKNRGLSIDYKALLASQPEHQAQMPDIPPGLEEKLNTLKRLRDQELITEEEYQEKKKELLKEF